MIRGKSDIDTYSDLSFILKLLRIYFQVSGFDIYLF